MLYTFLSHRCCTPPQSPPHTMFFCLFLRMLVGSFGLFFHKYECAVQQLYSKSLHDSVTIRNVSAKGTEACHFRVCILISYQSAQHPGTVTCSRLAERRTSDVIRGSVTVS
ncbi:hypothetical protein DFH94DRAFT_394811 [Russula ochroleuca]|uniref:Uncharacterized protein n=1 Tax=Russula ochroleuca TaxID=152965 RepID=A0A9P5JV35_9AGAM|nr:hypothetical protein DFH94DRAFT_394811 [Russula ochroleuca]